MQSEIGGEDWLWTLGSLAQLQGIAFDADLLKGEFSPPFDGAALVRAAQALGLDLARHRTDAKSVASLPTPLVAWRCTSAGPPESPDESPDQPGGKPVLRKPALILRADADRLLYIEARREQPRPCGGDRDAAEPDQTGVGNSPHLQDADFL